MRHTKAALLKALDNLPMGRCKLSMTRFGTNFQPWSDNNNLYNNDMKVSAVNWVNQLAADMGGTELQSCFDHILGQKAEPEYKRQILLITDAAIYDTRGITSLVKQHYENASRDDGSVLNQQNRDPQNRFFVLGVGNGVSKSLCEDIANAGGGIAAFAQADSMVAEKTARLLAYAVRRPPLPVRNENFQVQLFRGTQQIQPAELEQLDPDRRSGFTNNLFNNTPIGPVSQSLTEEVTHLKYACILDSVPESGIRIEVTARMNYSDEGNVVHSATYTKDLQLQVTAGKNPLYYSYIKDEVNRIQAWLDEFGSPGNQMFDQQRTAEYKDQMIKLSTNTNLLCSLTAFIGVKKSLKRQASSSMEVDQAQRPRYEVAADSDVAADAHARNISNVSESLMSDSDEEELDFAPDNTFDRVNDAFGQLGGRAGSSGGAPRRAPRKSGGVPRPAGAMHSDGNKPSGGSMPAGSTKPSNAQMVAVGGWDHHRFVKVQKYSCKYLKFPQYGVQE